MVRVVAAAIIRDGACLVAERGPGMAHSGCWEFPGGKVEHGEDDREALAREIQEELGITVTVLEYLGETDWNHRIRLVLYRCQLVQGVPTASEHSQLRWVKSLSQGQFTWAPADIPLLSLAQACLGNHPLQD